jgi:toxin YoeB
MIYEIKYTPEAEEDIEALKKTGNKAVLIKLNNLLMELMEHPYTGTGKPKSMKYKYAGYYSRRITQKHRLVYFIDNKDIIVLVLSVSGHYDDK